MPFDNRTVGLSGRKSNFLRTEHEEYGQMTIYHDTEMWVVISAEFIYETVRTFMKKKKTIKIEHGMYSIRVPILEDLLIVKLFGSKKLSLEIN